MANNKRRKIVVELTHSAPRIALRDAFMAYAMQPSRKLKDQNLAESKTADFFVRWHFVEGADIKGSFLIFAPFPGMEFAFEEGGDKIVIRDKEKIMLAWFWAKHVDGIRYL